MLETSVKSDIRCHALILAVLQKQERDLFPYILRDGHIFTQQDLVRKALDELDDLSRLIITLRYRLDLAVDEHPSLLHSKFGLRSTREIRQAAKGKIPKSVLIRPSDIKVLCDSHLYPFFSQFLIPTPEEMAQLREELGRKKEDNQRLVGALEDTRTLLAEAEKEKQTLQRKVQQLKKSRLSSKIRRIFSRSKAVPE